MRLDGRHVTTALTLMLLAGCATPPERAVASSDAGEEVAFDEEDDGGVVDAGDDTAIDRDAADGAAPSGRSRDGTWPLVTVDGGEDASSSAPEAGPDPDAAADAEPDGDDGSAHDAGPDCESDVVGDSGQDAALDAAVQSDAEPDAPADCGPDAPSEAAASLWACSALPAFDAATVAHVADVFARGSSLGRRPDVFAKAGDSITASPYFLFDVGAGECVLGAYEALSPTIERFRATPLPGGGNSFDRTSLTAVGGTTTSDALASPSPFRAELDAISPAYVVLQYGTNDLYAMTVTQFSTNLASLVDMAESCGVVVILSTIPDRVGASIEAATFADAIRTLAVTRHLPLIDLHLALAALPESGLSSDGVHPSVEMDGRYERSCDLTPAGLSYGYDLRNLLTLQMLDRLVALH